MKSAEIETAFEDAIYPGEFVFRAFSLFSCKETNLKPVSGRFAKGKERKRHFPISQFDKLSR